MLVQENRTNRRDAGEQRNSPANPCATWLGPCAACATARFQGEGQLAG
jgi:hypothetical protein